MEKERLTMTESVALAAPTIVEDFDSKYLIATVASQ